MADNPPIVKALKAWPDLAALHQSHPDRYPFLLESVAHGPAQARWDFLLGFPGERLWQDANGIIQSDIPDCTIERGFLETLSSWWRSSRKHRLLPDGIPFAGGWFLFFAYEIAGEIEPILSLPTDVADPLPRACAVRVPVAILRDHQTRQAWLVGEADAIEQITQAAQDLAVTHPLGELPPAPVKRFEEDAPQQYLDAVERARRYIYDGDIFQANLSRRWHGELKPGSSAFDCYRRLREYNPAPFAGYMRWSSHVAVASSSPERLVRVHGESVESRPIAGTRRRGADKVADEALSLELLAHPKERAEHVMLIDLERNDLGRICEYGSVEVNEMMVIESYATVHHIVSNIRGRLRTGIAPGDVVAATFPGGTITGCPKVRCMQIIAELEGVPRGAYTGSFGWLDHSGDMDLNILIRTLTVRGTQADFRAGGGIVADSIAERELDESRAKAAGLLRSLETHE